MPRYAVFFTLKAEAIARAMQHPRDRVAGVSKAVESAGGKLEAYYLMFGQYDGCAIVDLPDCRAAGASSLAVCRTGAFEHLEPQVGGVGACGPCVTSNSTTCTSSSER